ncbi:hypothetical protein TTHERM_000237291 (macronuclear) [Tetrahymena thermophila SB210]|uniref:Uncharacterized protein n=1 Tax=Tetrahymena thermophila (strain SB210) TaxID=312017 RepID=W7XFZ3_TETTS|nr:hypothetical protein TTHERM_000237291 [Tetrahymena thermophila SB210]EWS71769.1 hypothetical protein TTHERM_000237291 [Tetrahymena thermophila SB210]|eukprot:XP_012655656.1 hypothetical protein TTHERM_000237291 [Tetrahymena thermophila SB210]
MQKIFKNKKKKIREIGQLAMLFLIINNHSKDLKSIQNNSLIIFQCNLNQQMRRILLIQINQCCKYQIYIDIYIRRKKVQYEYVCKLINKQLK